MRDTLETIGLLLLSVPLILLAFAVIVPYLAILLGITAVLAVGLAVAMPLAALMGKPMKITVTKKESDAE